MSNVLLWIIGGFVLNQIVGSIVLGLMDDEDGTLRMWATTCPVLPTLVFILVVQMWPVVAVTDLICRRRRIL